MTALDEFFPLNKGFGAPASSQRWSKMAKLWTRDGVVLGVDNQFGNAGVATTYAGGVVTLQSGAVWIQGFYGELLASAPLAVTTTTTGLVVVHLDTANNLIEIIPKVGVTSIANGSPAATDFYVTLWQVLSNTLIDKRILVGRAVPTAVSPQPAVPASGVALVNSPPNGANAGISGTDCIVHISGGAVTAINIAGTVTGLTSGTFVVPGGQSITLTYSTPPTWVWFIR